MKYPVVIGSNCCAGNFYHNFLNMPFYSPFIWAVCPYFSIQYLLENWPTINWWNFEVKPNKERPLTYSLIIDSHVVIHYVHYFISNRYTDAFLKGASVFSKHIVGYLTEKYIERTLRMLSDGEVKSPYFIIHEEEFANGNPKNRLHRILTSDSPYKRAVITHSFDLSYVTVNPETVKYIFHPNKLLPEQMIDRYGESISRFFDIDTNHIDTLKDISVQ